MKKVSGCIGILLLFFGAISSQAKVIVWEEINTSGQDGINTSVWTKDIDNRAGGANSGLYVGTNYLMFSNGKRDYSHIERSVDGSKLASVT